MAPTRPHDPQTAIIAALDTLAAAVEMARLSIAQAVQVYELDRALASAVRFASRAYPDADD